MTWKRGRPLHHLPGVLVAALAACTPLGVWVYDDPSFTLRSATLRPGPDSAAGMDSMDLVFFGCNRNDYELQGEEFETRLSVDGNTVGKGRLGQPYYLAARDSASLTVTVALSQPWEASREFPAELATDLLIKWPNGERRIAVVQKGTVVQREGAVYFKAQDARACRPGLSTLPNDFGRPVIIERPEDRRPPPRIEGVEGRP